MKAVLKKTGGFAILVTHSISPRQEYSLKCKLYIVNVNLNEPSVTSTVMVPKGIRIINVGSLSCFLTIALPRGNSAEILFITEALTWRAGETIITIT
jgi:hypothetical protein